MTARRCTAPLFLLLPLAACQPHADDSASARACNGLAALCDRPLDAVAVAMTHNAMSSEEDDFLAPNQRYGLTRQLEDGIRGFMLDIHPWEEEAWLCHGDCLLGRTRLADGLAPIRDFLSSHPDEVLVFMLESYVEPAWVEDAFREAGLDTRARVQAVDTPWPTLAELLDAGTPLLVFTQDEGGDVPWLLAGYRDFVWDTPYAARSAEDFSCDVLRGDPARPLFLMNHFLTNPIALPALAEEVNFDPLLSARIDQCSAEAGQPVDWVAVDFYDIGDVVAAVGRLNRTGQAAP